jgi:DNA-directed RNA polymerase subunit RPC12/RpoP
MKYALCECSARLMDSQKSCLRCGRGVKLEYQEYTCLHCGQKTEFSGFTHAHCPKCGQLLFSLEPELLPALSAESDENKRL